MMNTHLILIEEAEEKGREGAEKELAGTAKTNTRRECTDQANTRAKTLRFPSNCRESA